MRHIWLGLSLLLFTMPVAALSAETDYAAKPICQKSFMDWGDKLLCKEKGFRKKDVDLVHLYLELKGKFSGLDRDILMSTQNNWRFDLFDCANAQPGHPDYEQIRGCFRDVLDKRLTYLRAVRLDPSRLTVNPPLYGRLDVWYAEKFADQYIGRSVTLVGRMTDLECDKDPPPPHARIRGVSPPVSIPVEFKGLNFTDADFLCPKIGAPLWNDVPWEGELRRKDGQLYLYMSTLGGRPLPYSRPAPP